MVRSDLPGLEEVAQRRPIYREENRASDGVAGQRASLSAQGCLVAEELARSQSQYGLIRSVALAADFDLSVDHDVVLAGGVATVAAAVALVRAAYENWAVRRMERRYLARPDGQRD